MDQYARPSSSGPSAPGAQLAANSRTGEAGGVRPLVMTVIAFLLGAGVSALWFYRAAHRESGGVTQVSSVSSALLSQTTLKVLAQLDSPVEVRFYSLFAQGSVPDSVREFAGRVDQLLSEFERQANGRITLVRNQRQTDAAADAASADGIRPFNMDKGDACFLGIAVARQEQKETFPMLSPDWEPALEFDLARAIARVTAPKAAGPAPAVPAFDAAATEAVRKALPNLANVSLAEGKNLLRQRAVAEYAAALRDMESQVKQAEQRLIAAQGGDSEAELQAATKDLQQLRADHVERLKELAARSQAQIAALEVLKR